MSVQANIPGQLSFITMAAMIRPTFSNFEEKSMFLQCQSSGLDSFHGSILATYSEVSPTECASKCDKFFFKPSGDSNCMCTSTTGRPKTAVVLDSSQPISRLAYFTGCDGIDQNQYGYYDIATASESPNRRLLQISQLATAQRPLARLSAIRAVPTPKPLILTPLAQQLRASDFILRSPGFSAFTPIKQTPTVSPFTEPIKQTPTAGDLCYDQQISNKKSVPASCTAGTKFVLPREWLEMNKLASDAADPCQKYKSPVGVRDIQCVTV
jgi:hypothetical protein